MGMQAWDLETFQNSVLKSAKIRRRRKKSPVKFRQKIKTTFLGHEFFLLFKLKLQYFVQESAAKFTIFFIFCKKKSFSKIQFFLLILSPIWPCAILCAGAILCAPTVFFQADFWIFFLYVLYSTLLHLPPLRFHCVGECWDRTQDCCDFGMGSLPL